MKKSQYEIMTGTREWKLIVRLSVPTILSMLVTNFYNIVDTAFVGSLGDSQNGAVGVVFGYMAVVQAFAYMIGQGAGNLVSRSLGRQDVERASILTSTGFFSAIAIGTAISVLSAIFLDPLVYLLGSTDTIAPYAKEYITYIIIGVPFLVGSLVLNNILRYEGKAKLGMVGLMTGAVLNIGGDALFMFGFNMGVGGAGLATALSQMVSFIILLLMFLLGKTDSKLSPRLVRLWPAMLFDMAATGFPSMLRQGLNSFATILLNDYAAACGELISVEYADAAVAAMSNVSRIVFFVFSVAIGVGQAFQPVCGFNYGAGKFSRVRKAYKFTLLYSEALITVAIIAVIILAEPILALINDSPDVLSIGARALRLQCLSMLIMPFSSSTEMFLQCTGRKLGAALLSGMRSGIFFIPALIILSELRGIAGIQEAQPIAYLLTSIAGMIFMAIYLKKLPKNDME